MTQIYSRLKICLLIITLAGSCNSLKAQDWNQIIKVATGELPGDRKERSQFGNSVAVSGNYAVVGARSEGPANPNGSNIGAAYILFNSEGNWKIVKKLALSNASGMAFGLVVSISGDDVAITDLDKSGSNSSVYLFSRNLGGANNWGFVKKISAPENSYIPSFANTISLSGDYLAVASSYELDGSVRIYKRNQGGSNNWGLLKTLSAPKSEQYDDLYGFSICLSGDRLIVGAVKEDEDLLESNPLQDAGAAYIYRSGKGGADNWGLMAKVIAPTRAPNDHFGWAVSISGDYAIIGSTWEDQDAQEANTLLNPGAAYIFKKEPGTSDNWVMKQKLTAPERLATSIFGRAVAISGDVAVVSDATLDRPEFGGYNQETGSIHVFKLGVGTAENWGHIKKIDYPDPTVNSYFSKVLALNDQFLFVGAFQDNTDGNGENQLPVSGSLFIYSRGKGGTDNWGLLKKETRTIVERKASDQFGYQVAMSGNYAVVGAPGEDEDENGINPVTDAGAAYVLENKSGKWVIVKKLIDPSRTSKRFGTAVSIFDDNIVIGSRYTETDLEGLNPLNEAGAVFTFSKNQGGANNWGFVQKLIDDGREPSDEFGASVALSHNYLIVGSNGWNEENQHANIYKQDANTNLWSLTSILPADGHGMKFGASVSIYDNYASVASSNFVILFKKGDGSSETWEEVQEIELPVVTTYHYSGGRNVELNATLNDNYLLVGAPYGWEGDQQGSGQGGVLLYLKDEGGVDQWNLAKILTTTTSSNAYHFGAAVSMSGNNILVGAAYAEFEVNGQNNFTGAAYLFNKDKGGLNNWGMVEQFTQPNKKGDDNFGEGVSISGNYFIVGSAGEDEDASELNQINDAGAIYVFRKTDGDVTEMAIPDQPGEYQSDYTIQEGDFTHYCTQNYLLLSLEHAGTGANIPAAAVKFKIGEGASFYSGNTGFLAGTAGSAVINRLWSVDPLTEPALNVKVRFYYTDQEFEEINAALLANDKKVLTDESQMFFYKVKDNSLGEFPDIKDIPANKVQVITNGAEASLTTWKKGVDQGNKYAEFLVSSFSGGGAGGTSPGSALPVTLSSFEATKQENAVLLEWETSMETNSDYFEIERSQDARIWQTLSAVKAAGAATETHLYRLVDDQPSNGKNFYRLKMIDLDNSFAYSRILGVDFNTNSLINVYPNPVSDRVFITGIPQGNIQSVQVINSLGQIMFTSKISGRGLQITHIQPGLYTLRIIEKNGAQHNKQVIIAH